MVEETRPTTNSAQVVCKSCGSPYPTEACDVPVPSGYIWECGPCLEIKHIKLLAELKEKARLKALEREEREATKR